MRAAVLYGPDDLRYVSDFPDPQIGPDEILVRVRACAVCGTDIKILEGKKTRGIHYPSIIGHEFAGDVAVVGPQVKGFAVGDRVAVEPVIHCRRCYYCLSGMENLCANRTAIGYEFDGAFAEYVRIPATGLAAGTVQKIPDEVSYAEGALAEPLGCCINGNVKSRIKMGDTVLIVGAGPIGLMHIQLARAAGARKVLVSETLEHRRQTAGKFGADVLIDPLNQSLKEAVLGETGGLGVDSSIMAVGVTRAVGDLLQVTRKGGTVNLFAGFPGAGLTEIEANIIHYNELVVTGTSSSTRMQYRMALNLIASRSVDAQRLITETLPLERSLEAFEAVKTGRGLKPVVVP